MKDWGKGIPKYTKYDLMTQEELLDFAMQAVASFEFEKNNYQIVAATNKLHQIPNFVVKKENQLYFIVVKASIAPQMPVLSDDERRKVLSHAEKFEAKCFFAAVGFGATDAERFKAGLALRGDAFYSNYCGLEEI